MKKGIIFTIEAIIGISIIIMVIGAITLQSNEKNEELNKITTIIEAGAALNFNQEIIEEEKENYYCLDAIDYNLFEKEYSTKKTCGGFE